jgi:hypothetical protein
MPTIMIRISKRISRISEDVKEITTPSFWTASLEEQTTKCRFPRRHAGKFNIELTTSIPSALELLECRNSISFTGVFNVHVPSQVRLTIAAHLELYHLTALFKLRQNIFIKFPEMLIRFCIIILQHKISVVFINQ